jgi:hypothetical protein
VLMPARLAHVILARHSSQRYQATRRQGA